MWGRIFSARTKYTSAHRLVTTWYTDSSDTGLIPTITIDINSNRRTQNYVLWQLWAVEGRQLQNEPTHTGFQWDWSSCLVWSIRR